MTGAGNAAPAAQQIGAWPRALLLAAILIELFGSLSSLPILAGDLNEIPGPGLDGGIILASIILRPIAALAALLALVRGHFSWALVAMAVVILLNWVNFLPSVRLHGLDFGTDGTGGLATFLFTLVVLILPPILAVGVSALALAGRNLTLAALLAVLPTMFFVASVIAFGISVAIYGF